MGEFWGRNLKLKFSTERLKKYALLSQAEMMGWEKK
jgi:hypothetical protein